MLLNESLINEDFPFSPYRNKLTTTLILPKRQLTSVKYTKIMAVLHKYHYTEFSIFKDKLSSCFDWACLATVTYPMPSQTWGTPPHAYQNNWCYLEHPQATKWLVLGKEYQAGKFRIPTWAASKVFWCSASKEGRDMRRKEKYRKRGYWETFWMPHLQTGCRQVLFEL